MIALWLGVGLLALVLGARAAKRRKASSGPLVLEDLGDGGVGWARDPLNGRRDRGGF